MASRRTISYFFLFFVSTLIFSCKSDAQDKSKTPAVKESHAFKFSLGQWSFNKEMFAGTMTNVDFINKTKELGFDGVDFVSQFFSDKVADLQFLDSLKNTINSNGLDAVMIMIDQEGDLGNPNTIERKKAVENHKKWIKAAKYIGCESVRVNAHGEGSPEEVMEACVTSIGALADYAKAEGILVLIENHGGYSSDANWLVSLMEQLKNKTVALLPDFDNWCIERENGARWSEPCINEYDRYKGMKQLLPYAKSLSVKSFGFDAEGNEITTDYKRVFNLVHEIGYKEYLGIEFEGDQMPPEEGIKKTLSLVNSILNEFKN